MDGVGEEFECCKVFIPDLLLEPFPESLDEVEMRTVWWEKHEEYFLFFGIFLYYAGSLVSGIVQYHIYGDIIFSLFFII